MGFFIGGIWYDDHEVEEDEAGCLVPRVVKILGGHDGPPEPLRLSGHPAAVPVPDLEDNLEYTTKMIEAGKAGREVPVVNLEPELVTHPAGDPDGHPVETGETGAGDGKSETAGEPAAGHAGRKTKAQPA